MFLFVYKSRPVLSYHIYTEVPITHDALRMRARRLCEKKGSGKCAVPDAIHDDYVSGGEAREILEMALLQSLAMHGCDRKHYKKIRVVWLHKVHAGVDLFLYVLHFVPSPSQPQHS